MPTALKFEILPQPDNVTCGPTCLHAVYRYFGDEVSLTQVIGQSPQLEEGGTLAVLLGCHALRRGYHAVLYTFNLQVFDPTWFHAKAPPLADRLRAQAEYKDTPKLRVATQAYLDFLALGGSIRMEDITNALIRGYLKQHQPILTGLSATYLYGCAREYGPNCEPDDVRGYPVGHFVVLCDYDRATRMVLVADPFLSNPLGEEHHYHVPTDRLIRAIMLGVLTYDANLLIVEPRSKQAR